MKKHITLRVNGLLIHVDRFKKIGICIEIYRGERYIGYFPTGRLKCIQNFISTSENFQGDKFLVYTLKED